MEQLGEVVRRGVFRTAQHRGFDQESAQAEATSSCSWLNRSAFSARSCSSSDFCEARCFLRSPMISVKVSAGRPFLCPEALRVEGFATPFAIVERRPFFLFLYERFAAGAGAVVG